MKKVSIKVVSAYLCHFIFLFSLSITAIAQEKEQEKLYELKIETFHQEGKNIALITAKGKQGYYINVDYPWQLNIQAVDGLNIEKHKYLKSDAEIMIEEKAVFRIPFDAPQNMIVKANLKLAVCKDIKCVFEDVAISWSNPTVQ